jgi:hypothetical protein
MQETNIDARGIRGKIGQQALARISGTDNRK